MTANIMHRGSDPYHYNKMPNRNRGRGIGKEWGERRKGQGCERAGNYVRLTHTLPPTPALGQTLRMKEKLNLLTDMPAWQFQCVNASQLYAPEPSSA
jgi:hypothetical protein